MKWNIYSRVTVLEQQVKDLTDFSDSVKQLLVQLTGDIKRLEKKSFEQAMTMCKAGIAPDPRMPVFADEADQEKEKKRQYQRERYAKRKAMKEEEGKVEAQREKKNAYARAYYARTKGAKQ